MDWSQKVASNPTRRQSNLVCHMFRLKNSYANAMFPKQWAQKLQQESPPFCGARTWQQNNQVLSAADRARTMVFTLSPGLKNLTAASFKYLTPWKPQYCSSESWIMEKTNYYACSGGARRRAGGGDQVQTGWNIINLLHAARTSGK